MLRKIRIAKFKSLELNHMITSLWPLPRLLRLISNLLLRLLQGDLYTKSLDSQTSLRNLKATLSHSLPPGEKGF